jgi:hypothetical protein
MTITGTSGYLSHNTTVTFTFQDFNITANPTSITTTVGSSPTATLQITGINGFSRNVNLTASVQCSSIEDQGGGGGGHLLAMAPIQACPTLSLSPPSVSVPTMGSAFSSLMLNSSGIQAGNYVITVTATNSNLSHSITVEMTATDFGISAQPTSLTITAGSNATSVITLTSLNGFTGTISLTVSILPPDPTGTISPSNVTLTAGGSGTSTLTITTPSSAKGAYNVTITATSGNDTHSIIVTVNIQKQGQQDALSLLGTQTGLGRFIPGLAGLFVPLLLLWIAREPKKRPSKIHVQYSLSRFQRNTDGGQMVLVPTVGYVQVWKP